jgi:uncharacterized hydrophobic protein (TIGR00271 family)
MNEAPLADAGRSRGERIRDRIPLARWWRLAVVGSVDHPKVIERIVDESRFTARYLFMTTMSAGIAVLGLLLSSPSVVIGAMLISPLMGPILGVGFGLALFEFDEVRRALTAFLLGSLAAVLFTALIVLASPLQATTAEILARTRPSLFDLLVALFAALAGTFAIIRGRGEAIVGVAIATALMPPLAVVGYGLATWNLPVLTGSLALFGTNFFTIALASTVLARFYGFGHRLTRKQTLLQTGVLLAAFVAMAIPLAFALGQIAREALFVNQVRAVLADRFGPESRITLLDVDYHQDPWTVRVVVVAPRARAQGAAALQTNLRDRIGRDLDLHLNQILVDPAQGDAAQRAALARANTATVDGSERSEEVAALVSVAAGVPREKITLDRDRQRAVAAAVPLAGADLGIYYALERRASATAAGWTIEIVPPAGPLPQIAFADGSDALEGAARTAAVHAAWAARRWNVPAVVVPGLPAGERPSPETASLAARRAIAIAALLEAQGIRALPAPASGSSMRLAIPEMP